MARTTRTITKNSPYKATEPHISIIAHITRQELHKFMNETEAFNGFANRFLWASVSRDKILPFGGDLSDYELQVFNQKIMDIVNFSRQHNEITLSREVMDLWQGNKASPGIYTLLSRERDGIAAGILARAEAQVIRLSSLYAILDKSTEIRTEHLYAALAVWQYCEASVEFIFGTSESDPVAEKILSGLKSGAMSQTEIHNNIFKNHMTAKRLNEALQKLSSRNKIKQTKVNGKKVWMINNTTCEFANYAKS